MSTPHINANIGDFAKTVLMPGDPLRAKFIAENYLEDAQLVTDVRGMLGFTGKYKGENISTMGSGMGMPSIGIYSYELYDIYNVENIIRIGSCGAYSEKIQIRDLILASGASTNSNYAHQYNLPGTFATIADFDLLLNAYEVAKEKKIKTTVGNILSSDTFYENNSETYKQWKAMGILGVEMEAAALYLNAAKLDKKALCMLTVSDHFISGESTTSKERERTFTDMIEVALEVGISK